MRLFPKAAVAILIPALSVGLGAARPDRDAGKAASAKAPASSLMDINTATEAELKTLPGVSDAWAVAIIRHRPYQNKAQLRTRGVLSPAAYQRIRDKIIAKQ